jgi:iron-sulfur cluster assembly accessory protein
MASETPVTVTSKAAEKLREEMKDENKDPEKDALRIYVQGGGCSGFQYGLMLDENGKGDSDKEFESNGIKIFIDPISINYLSGAEVDFSEETGGFSIKNPNATSTCGCGQSFSAE